jgi:hypothetical protein
MKLVDKVFGLLDLNNEGKITVAMIGKLYI